MTLALTMTDERTCRKYIPIRLGIETSAPLIMAWIQRLPKFQRRLMQTKAARAPKISRTTSKADWAVSCGPACWAKIQSDSMRMVRWGLFVYGWFFSPKGYLSCAKPSRL